ncbi:MAG TPA: Trk system potassium transporter TrkA, partial [Cyclobacteriaceae bacterium]|nr:Trk system potassium transporter TrkA [Cyclobacteriaceae bacterium]
EIKRLLRDVGTTDSFDFDNGKLSLVGTVLEPNNVLVGKKINELEIQGAREDFNAVAILRNNETIIPHGNTSFESGDHAYFIAPPGGIDNIMHIFGKKKTTFKSIMLLGGSKVGYHTAVKLSKKFNVKLIEKDKQKCFELADKLPDVMVINGDGRDVELLKEEGIEEMDAFIAVTGNSETNILSCLVAKNHNVKKTISLVENIDYIHLSQNIGVDTMINKKLIAANFIFRYVREGEVISLTSIHGVDAEVLEFIVKPGSKITESFIKDLHFPPNAIIGGVVRNGMGYTTKGDFQFRPGDRAVVLSKPSCLYKVEEFFK